MVDAKAQQAQDKADQGDAFGVFATFKELRLRGSLCYLVKLGQRKQQRRGMRGRTTFGGLVKGRGRLMIGFG